MRTSLIAAASLALVTGLAPQLVAPTMAEAAPSGRKLATGLTGAMEVPGPGDPDGSGSARITINVGQQTLCYELAVSDIAPATAAHIHEASAGQAGPVVVPLAAPSDGSASGCVTLSREELKEIAKNADRYYVNVYNAQFPAGALRGQLGT